MTHKDMRKVRTISDQATREGGYLSGSPQDQLNRANGFRKCVGGSNFMTPVRLGFYRGKANPYLIVELSAGEGIRFGGKDPEPIIGFTVANTAQGENVYELSTCCETVEEVLEAFRKLEAYSA